MGFFNRRSRSRAPSARGGLFGVGVATGAKRKTLSPFQTERLLLRNGLLQFMGNNKPRRHSSRLTGFGFGRTNSTREQKRFARKLRRANRRKYR